MLLLLFTATAYFYYNWQYFRLVQDVQEAERRHSAFVLLCFVINYGFFYMCSMIEFPLALNWSLFTVLLFLETLFYNRGDKRCALFSTWLGIIFGLAATIACRSVTAIVMNETLLSFDNNTTSAGNLKGVPVFLGFLLAGVLLRYLRRPSSMKQFKLIIAHPQHQSFLLEIMAGLCAYLFLNLLLYSTPLNDLLLKVWSIKSCLFTAIGIYIAMWYTRRICELDDYREKNRRIEQRLQEQWQEEQLLRQQATMDVLTGLLNRQCAEGAMDALIAQNTPFSLCFLDLDGLKRVNDCYGHDEGDRYILTAAEEIRRACRNGEDQLFRYGGDEFLILFIGMPADIAEKRAKQINERLTAAQEAFPYSMSLSYGVAESALFSEWKNLVQRADERMYAQKQEKRTMRTYEETLE